MYSAADIVRRTRDLSRSRGKNVDDSQPSEPKRRRFQFSLRALLLFVTVAGVGFGWLGRGLRRAARHRQAVAEFHQVETKIAGMGGSISYEYAEGPPNWIMRLLGDPGTLDVKVAMHEATDADLTLLKGLEGTTQSWELDLSPPFRRSNGVTDAGLEHLKLLTSLRRLRLAGTGATAAGVGNLQEALPGTIITPNARQLAAIAEIEKTGGIVHFFRGLEVSSVRTPKDPPAAAGSSGMTDAAMVHVKELTDLRRLFLWGPRFGDAGLVHLGGLTALEDLTLSETRVTDAGLVHLKGLTSLRILSLGDTLVTDAGLQHLAKLANLQELYLDDTYVTDAGLVNLKGLTSLETLWLSDTQVADAGLVHLEGLPSLRWLKLLRTQVTDAGLAHLAGVPSLRQVNLSGTRITDAGLMHLKGLTGLRTLRLRGTQVTDAGLQHLKGLSNLDCLELSGTNVGDAGLSYLVGLTKLRQLSLRGTKVTEGGKERLRRTLPNCSVSR